MICDEQTRVPAWGKYSFKAICFLLVFASRFFLNYFQSYHALQSFIPASSGIHNVTRLTCLKIFGVILALLTIISYLMVRWHSLHEGLQCHSKKEAAVPKNPHPNVCKIIFCLNFLGILVLSAYAALESISKRKKFILGALVMLSMMGALPTTILFSKKNIKFFFINFKKLPKIKSVVIGVGTFCMTPLIVIALHTTLTLTAHLAGLALIGGWSYFAWGVCIFVGLGYITGEFLINCRLPNQENTIKAIQKRYSRAQKWGKRKLGLAIFTGLVFLLGASFVMAGGAYIGTYRCMMHFTSATMSKTVSLVLFFITFFVALFGSFGEDFLGKMVNKIISPKPPLKEDKIKLLDTNMAS